jgi:hypothetical protein
MHLYGGIESPLLPSTAYLFIDTCPAQRHCIYHQTIAPNGDATLEVVLRPFSGLRALSFLNNTSFIPRHSVRQCYRRSLLLRYLKST